MCVRAQQRELSCVCGFDTLPPRLIIECRLVQDHYQHNPSSHDLHAACNDDLLPRPIEDNGNDTLAADEGPERSLFLKGRKRPPLLHRYRVCVWVREIFEYALRRSEEDEAFR